MESLATPRISHTTHIFRTDRGWVLAVRRMGDEKTPHSRDDIVYRTQKEAVDAAIERVRSEPAAQVVVHSKTGLMRRPYVHGLPVIQRAPVRSSLGRANIQRAISNVIRKELVGE